MTDFDKYFQSFPEDPDKPKDWNAYWKNQIEKLKKIPLETKQISKKASIKKTRKIVELEFNAVDKYRLKAKLITPIKILKKAPVLVVYPDYSEETADYENLADFGIAVFLVILRGHEEQHNPVEKTEAEEEETQESFGFFKENLLNKNDYYLRCLYLDAYRTLEVLRLQSEIDKNKIYLLGTGTGASMALFAQVFMPRAKRLLLMEPSHAYYSRLHFSDKTLAAKEIRDYINTHKAKKPEIEMNLKYFDTLYLTENLETSVSMIVDFQVKDNYPPGSFTLFHSMKCDKDMHVFVENPLRNNKKDKFSLVANTVLNDAS